MYCAGCLMSHVLQWTQFFALITKRGSLFRRGGINRFIDGGGPIETASSPYSGSYMFLLKPACLRLTK
jgi:hypothetical protein